MATFEQRVAKISEFRNTVGRFPRRNGAEDSDYAFLMMARRNLNLGKLTPARRALLDSALPGWDAQRLGERLPPRGFRTQAVEIAEFVRSEHRWPRTHGTDLSADERRLGFRLSRIRGAASGWKSQAPITDAQRMILDDVLPGWDGPITTRVNRSHAATFRQCSTSGCDSRVVARGMCGAHYAQYRRTVGGEWKSRRVPWTPEEDVLVMSKLSRTKIAHLTGRTLWSITGRRALLKQQHGIADA